VLHPSIPGKALMSHVTFRTPDLHGFCLLDEMGLPTVGRAAGNDYSVVEVLIWTASNTSSECGYKQAGELSSGLGCVELANRGVKDIFIAWI
jgi:hypothetical protein